MKTVYLSGGKREQCFQTLVQKNVVNIIALIIPEVNDINKDRFERLINIANDNNIEVVQVNKTAIYNTIKDFKPELLISCGFPYILKEEVLKLVKYPINIHPTLLPKYRGFLSGAYIIMNGDKQTGVTIHMMEKEVDKGLIIKQHVINLSPFDTIRSMMRKTSEIEGELLVEAITDLKENKVKSLKQDEKEASFYPGIRTPDDSLIDWTKPLKDLYNEIRACDPDNYPAHFYLNGEKVCIKMWRSEKPNEEKDMI